jgi:uncharacterized membrane protein
MRPIARGQFDVGRIALRPAVTLAAMGLASMWPSVAYAYIGPGLGAGALAVVLGAIASVFLALFAIVFYPIKRILKRRKQKKELRLKQKTESGTC